MVARRGRTTEREGSRRAIVVVRVADGARLAVRAAPRLDQQPSFSAASHAATRATAPTGTLAALAASVVVAAHDDPAATRQVHRIGRDQGEIGRARRAALARPDDRAAQPPLRALAGPRGGAAAAPPAIGVHGAGLW